MRHDQYKLIRLEGYGYRLYDLYENLGETMDLSDSHPDLLQYMQLSLIEWEQSLVAPQRYEDEDWNRVTYEIHEALMDNRKARYTSPQAMQAFEK